MPPAQTQPRVRKEVEDPNNTWNQQFIAACLEHKQAEAIELINKGADPAVARECTPFSKTDKLSPLAAVLLQGNLTQESLDMASFLVRSGCSLSDTLALPDLAVKIQHQQQQQHSLESAATERSRPGSRSASPVIEKDTKDMGDRPFSAMSATGRLITACDPLKTDMGSILHYLISLNDHAHLLKLLVLACDSIPGLPHSLLRDIELEMSLTNPTFRTAAPAEPSPRSARGRRPKSSTPSRRGSVKSGASRSVEEVTRPITNSPLPTLTELPPLAPDTWRIFLPTVSPSKRRRSVMTPPPDGSTSIVPGSGQTPVVPTAPPSDASLSHRPCEASSDLAPTPELPASPRGKGMLLELLVTEAVKERAVPTKPFAKFDFNQRTTVSGLTPLEYALALNDTLSARLLTFFSSSTPFSDPVNGSQTALARACASGDVALVEKLLDAGDSLSQISADGRYTLIHYAVGQPAVLEYLIRRGLSVDTENAFGDSALVSLIRYGTGRNADYAAKEAPRMSDAPKLAALPYCALRNYILTPLTPLILGNKGKGGGAAASSAAAGGAGGGARGSKSAAAANAMREAAAAAAAMNEVRPTIGGGEVDTWWSFTPLPTADLLVRLVECGANVHGVVPNEELGLSYMYFAEDAANTFAAAAATPTRATQRNQSRETGGKRAGGRAGKQQALQNDSSIGDASFVSTPMLSRSLPDTSKMAIARVPSRATPLMHAIMGYHPELIRKLAVDYRADVMRRDSHGACALHYAALCTQPSVMELLLSSLVSNVIGFDVNAADMAGRTALHYAAATGNAAVMASLLRVGPTLQAGRPDKRGLTPLHVAVLANETQCVELLLRHSDVVLDAASTVATSRRSPSSNKASSRSGRGNAAAAGGAGAASASSEYMLPDVEAEDKVRSATALEMAILDHKDPTIVRLLLSEAHPSMQRASGLHNGGSLLHRAVHDGQVAYVQLLLEFYADANEPDQADETPLLIAVDRDDPRADIISCLMTAGAQPNAQSVQTLRTPMLVAAARGHPAEVLDLLFYQEDFKAVAAARRNLRRRASAAGRKGSVVSLCEDSAGASGTTSIVGGAARRARERREQQQQQQQQQASNADSKRTRQWVDDVPSSSVHSSSASAVQVEDPAAEAEEAAVAAVPRRLVPLANFFFTDAEARSPLHLLCSHTSPSKRAHVMPVIRELLQLDDEVVRRLCWAIDTQGRRPLHIACEAHFVDAARLLLEVDPSSVLCIDARGYTPLHASVSAAHYPPTPAAVAAALRGDSDDSSCMSSVDDARQDTEKITEESEEDRVRRVQLEMESTMDAIAHAIRVSVPDSVTGFAMPLSSTGQGQHNMPDPSIRTQVPLSALLRQRTQWKTFSAANGTIQNTPASKDLVSMNSLAGVPLPISAHQRSSAANSTMGSPLSKKEKKKKFGGIGDGCFINDFAQYAQLMDSHGRTALLLAGERGDVASASKIMRLVRRETQ